LLFSTTDIEEESQDVEETDDEDVTTSSAQFWIALSTIIMTLTVILAVVLSYLRRIELKKYQVKKPTKISYDRATTVSPEIVIREAKNRKDSEIKMINQEIKELEEYLANSKINLIFLLVDIRHKPTDLDKQMMRFLFQSGLAFKIVATKADKIPKSKISVYIKIVANELMLGTGDIVPFSCETKKGKEEILALIDRFCFKQPNDSDLINFDDENKQGE